MKNRFFGRLAVAVVLSGALPAAAQTGRIAHLSHGGSTATLSASVASDNFGLPPDRHESVTDSLVYLNDSVAVSYGRYRSVSFRASDAELKKAPWHLNNDQIRYYSGQYQPQRWQEALKELQQRHPQARLVGFEKQLKKRGRKKPVGHTEAFPRRPFQYSVWRGLAGVAGMGAVGWLLGRKRAA